MKFTDSFVRNLQTDKRLEDIREGAGFGVRVFYTGTKIFYFGYTFDSKRRCLNLGEYRKNLLNGLMLTSPSLIFRASCVFRDSTTRRANRSRLAY